MKAENEQDGLYLGVSEIRCSLRRRVALLIYAGLSVVLGCHAPGTGYNIEGVQHFQQGQPQAAITQFQQAIAENPANTDAYYNLAATYHYLGKQNSDPALLRQSESLYHQCLDLSPDHVACHRGLAVLLVDSDRAQSAFTLLERWATRSPHVADARIELARLHEEFGEDDTAQRYLGEAIDVDPTNSRAWSALARLREQDGQLAQALNNYQQAYHLNNYQPGVVQRIATLQQQLRVGGDLHNGTFTARGSDSSVNSDGWTKR